MGFKGVEIFENDFLVHDLKPKEIKKIVSDYGLEISLFQPFRDFEGMPEPYRSRAFDRAKKKFDIMNELGAKTILVCSNTSNLAVGGIDRAADDFNELGEIAKNQNIFIGYEAGYSYNGTNLVSGRNTVIGYQAGYDLGDTSTHNILIGEGVGAENVVLDKQLKIGSGSLITISGSLETGDVIFHNTASAPSFSGSFQGDGSGLTNLTAGSTSGRVVFTTTDGALTTESGFEYDTTKNQLAVDSLLVTHLTSSFVTASRVTTSGSNIFGDDTTDTQTLIGTTKMTGSAQITGSTQISGELKVFSSSPTYPSLKIDNNGYFYHLGRYTGGSAAFGGNKTNIAIGNDISFDGDYGWVVIGDSALASDTFNSGIVIGRQAQGLATGGITIGVLSKVYDTYGISLGVNAGNNSNAKGINIGAYAKGQGDNNIVLSSLGAVNVEPTKANTFGIYMTDASPNFEIEATGSSTLSGSSFTIEKSGSTVFEVLGSEGTLFSIDDDLGGTLFNVKDKTGIPIFEVSASSDVFIGNSPTSLYRTAQIVSTTANVTQSIHSLSTSSYDGAFIEYTAVKGTNARAGNIMTVWDGSNVTFTETTTTDIGDTSDLLFQVALTQSVAQIQSYTTSTGYRLKTIIKAI